MLLYSDMNYKKHGQFIDSYTNIKNILSNYGVDDFTYHNVDSGIENSTYIINSNNKKYALRVYRQNKKTLFDIKIEIDFMLVLKDKSLPVPEVFPTINKEKILNIKLKDELWQVILMEYISGHHTENYSPMLIKNLASYQARMHIAGIEFSKTVVTKKAPSRLRQTEFVDQILPDMINDGKVSFLIDRSKKYTLQLISSLPSGYSHFDYDSENVLVDNSDNIMGILDFDDIQYAPVVICLAFTLWSILFSTFDISSAKNYLKIYELIRPLSDQEKGYITQIILFRHYALATLFVLRGEMDKKALDDFLRLEKILINSPSILQY